MMRWLRAAAAVCVGMLCLLLLSCLVQQQAPAADKERSIPITAAVLVQRCVMPAESAAAAAVRCVTEHDRTETAWVCETHAPVCAPSCDRNGWIITGRTWPRTVYAVCPPEGMPG